MSKTLNVATATDHYQIEMDDDFTLPDLTGRDWVAFVGKDSSVSVHTKQIAALHLTETKE